jgi:hypothetical protein
MSEKAVLVCIDGPEDDTFPVTITVRNLKGVESTITFDCIPRTLTEWTKVGDQVRAEIAEKIKAEEVKAKAKAKKKADDGGESADPVKLEALVTERIQTDAGMGLKIAKGWSVTDQFGAAGLAKLENRFPGAIRDLSQAYSKRINGEREGN